MASSIVITPAPSQASPSSSASNLEPKPSLDNTPDSNDGLSNVWSNTSNGSDENPRVCKANMAAIIPHDQRLDILHPAREVSKCLQDVIINTIMELNYTLPEGHNWFSGKMTSMDRAYLILQTSGMHNKIQSTTDIEAFIALNKQIFKPTGSTICNLEEDARALHDPAKNITQHGSIGYIKHDFCECTVDHPAKTLRDCKAGHEENTTPKSIYSLPPELFSLISNFLTPYEVVRLSIASRRVYMDKADHEFLKGLRARKIVDEANGTYRYISTRDDGDRWAFMREMEANMPDHELCSYCRIFHPRPSAQQRSLQRRHPRCSRGTECNAQDVRFRPWGWGFGFRDVYAVMNRHLYHGNHGRPLTDFDFATNWTFANKYKDLWSTDQREPSRQFFSYIKLESEARVKGQGLGSHLLVHRVQRLWAPIHPQGTRMLSRYGAGKIARDFKICSHHEPTTRVMQENFIVPFRDGLKVVLAVESVTGETKRLPRIVRRCEECPTEYEVTFHLHDNKSVEIVLDVWNNLGECRHPLSPGWLNCWGCLNPRVFASEFGVVGKTQWLNSNVEYVKDKSVFSSGPGQSQLSHPSAAAVLQHWQRLQRNSNHEFPYLKSKGISAPVKPTMTINRFQSLLRSFTNSSCDVAGKTDELPFPDFAEGPDGPVMFAYTCTATRFYSRSPTSRDEPNDEPSDGVGVDNTNSNAVTNLPNLPTASLQNFSTGVAPAGSELPPAPPFLTPT